MNSLQFPFCFFDSGKWNRVEMTKKETDLMAEIGCDIT